MKRLRIKHIIRSLLDSTRAVFHREWIERKENGTTSEGVTLEDVQYLLGHADPRTTRFYDRRKKKVTRNIVERISVE